MLESAKRRNQLISDDDYNCDNDILVTRIRNLLESIPKFKFNDLINESQIGSGYMNPVLVPISNSTDKKGHLRW